VCEGGTAFALSRRGTLAGELEVKHLLLVVDNCDANLHPPSHPDAHHQSRCGGSRPSR
jgi:hypothetical protein